MIQLSFDDVDVWKSVVGFEAYYEVSSLGQVRSLDRMTCRGLRRGCLMKPQPGNKMGHLGVVLSVDGIKYPRRVHKMVAEAFIGSCPPGQEVRHWDGDVTNNRASNLLYGTRADNMRDQLRHGRNPRANAAHCPHDHEYAPDNTIINRNGARECKTCVRRNKAASARRAYARQHPARDLTRDCLVCSTTFTPSRDDARYCSKKCGSAGWRQFGSQHKADKAA